MLLDYRTPYECLSGKPPDMSNIRVFGCLCYASNLNHNGDKSASRSQKCVFVVYSFLKKDGNCLI